MSIDETIDSLDRSIVNITMSLTKVNHTTIAIIFDNSMHILWLGEVHLNNVLLYLSDVVPYIVKSRKAIQVFYSKIIHVICIVHGLSRIAENFCRSYFKDNRINENIKKNLKPPSSVAVFKDEATGVLLPPISILTRWGT